MSLNNALSNTVFLLGAGASMDAGCRNSRQMLDDLFVKINSIVDQNKKEVYADIFSFIIATLRFKFSLESSPSEDEEIINIEDFVILLRQLIFKEFILPDPFIGAWNNKILKWELRYPEIFTEFYTFIIENLINEWTKFDVEKAKCMLEPLRQLVSHDEVKRLDFFTLNYDLMFEEMFNSGGELGLETGFSGNVWRASFDEVSDAKIKYFKLHGSLDWHYDNENEEIELVDHGENNRDPLLIFGTGEKVVTIDPFLFLLGEFRRQLESASLYVIIGYSFSDQHINNLIIHCLKANTLRKMVVVDPKPDNSKDKLLKYIAKVQNKKLYYDTKNLTKLSPEKIEILRMGAKDFYSEYFSDSGNKLIELYKKYEEQELIF